MKPCLAQVATGKTTSASCAAPATLECLYAEDSPQRHYRCAEHRPPRGWFFKVRRIGGAS